MTRHVALLSATLLFLACGPQPRPTAVPQSPWLLAPDPANDLVHLDDTEASLRARFGDAAVQFKFLSTGRGDTVGATILFANDSARRVEVVWQDPIHRRHPGLVRIGRGSSWRVAPGIGIGTPLTTIDSINHRSVTLAKIIDAAETVPILNWNAGRLDTLWRRGDTLGVAVTLEISASSSRPTITSISIRPRARITQPMKEFVIHEPFSLDSCAAIDRKPKRKIDPSDSYYVFLAALPKTPGDWNKTERVDFGPFFLTLPVGSNHGTTFPGMRFSTGYDVSVARIVGGTDPIQQVLVNRAPCKDGEFLDPALDFGCDGTPIRYRITGGTGALYQSACGDCVNWTFTAGRDTTLVSIGIAFDDREDFSSSLECRVVRTLLTLEWKPTSPLEQ